MNEITCFNCGGRGHKASECYKGNMQANNRGRGYYRGRSTSSDDQRYTGQTNYTEGNGNDHAFLTVAKIPNDDEVTVESGPEEAT